jgi:hypothetical protein
MPIGFSPDETFWVKCPSTGEVEWCVRALSVADVRRLHKAFDEALNSKLADENGVLNGAILSATTGWRGDGLPDFGVDGLDHLTYEQKYSLLVELPHAATIGEREKKASRLRRASEAAQSASNAKADAPTPPASNPPSTSNA